MRSCEVLNCKRIQNELPELEPHDRNYVMGHVVALETSGIPNDASFERDMIEKVIIQFGWRLAFCRYVERCIAQCGEPVSYGEWRKTHG